MNELINNLKSKPNYNPQKAKNSILHFGVGNFHRAHQAFFIHEMLNSSKDVSIIGINLRSDETRRNLEKQKSALNQLNLNTTFSYSFLI